MASLKPEATINEFQDFIEGVYGLSNDRYFSVDDMLTNIERFLMRGLKGIRKNNTEKTKTNLLISLSWFMSLMNQFHIDIEREVWKRFPYLCSYCASCPCVCKEKKVEQRQQVFIDEKRQPKTLKDFQEMFEKIYPDKSRTLEHAGIHLAEEVGEFEESVLGYRGAHQGDDFEKIMLEAADLISCFFGVFNSLQLDLAKELSILFFENCHVCKKMPCECSYQFIIGFKS